MSATLNHHETITTTTTTITEYKEFNISSYGSELTEEFNTELNSLKSKMTENRKENDEKIDGYEKLHGEHKQLQKDNLKAHEGRVNNFDSMTKANDDYAKFAQNTNQENNEYRVGIADKENPLRHLENDVALLNLDNKNLQQVIDTEAALKDAKAQAEVVAVKAVNSDLKNQTGRLENDIHEEKAKKEEAYRILDDLHVSIYCSISYSGF